MTNILRSLLKLVKTKMTYFSIKLNRNTAFDVILRKIRMTLPILKLRLKLNFFHQKKS